MMHSVVAPRFGRVFFDEQKALADLGPARFVVLKPQVDKLSEVEVLGHAGFYGKMNPSSASAQSIACALKDDLDLDIRVDTGRKDIEGDSLSFVAVQLGKIRQDAFTPKYKHTEVMGRDLQSDTVVTGLKEQLQWVAYGIRNVSRLANIIGLGQDEKKDGNRMFHWPVIDLP